MLLDSLYTQTNWSCYVHLKCKRGSLLWCLDWREVCDGNIDCWNDAIDEQHCSQLEKSDCQENEFRCRNGQCISYDLLQDEEFTPDCLDASDENMSGSNYTGKALIINCCIYSIHTIV
jgi:hypothetical protein